jgi:hypothetical protein
MKPNLEKPMNIRSSRLTAILALTTALFAGQALAAKVNETNKQLNPQAGTTTLQSMTMAPPTLKTLAQHPYTNHGGGATSLDVGGAGHCSFSIESGSLIFTYTNQALPMVANLTPKPPVGNFQWIAKGTGKCTGTATANTHVEE